MSTYIRYLHALIILSLIVFSQQYIFGMLPLSVSINPPSLTVCENSSIMLAAEPSGGTAPYTYSWIGPNGFMANTQDIVIANALQADNGNFTVTVTDATANTDSASALVTVDPLLQTFITQPINSAQIPTSTVQFSGIGVAGSTVTLFANGSPIGSTVVTNSNTWTLTSIPLANGNYTITLQAQLGTNTCTESNSIFISVNTQSNAATPPQITLFPQVSASNKPIVFGQAQPNSTIIARASSSTRGSSIIGTTVSDNTGAWILVPALLLDPGTYSLTFTATNRFGNISEPSSAITIVINPSDRTVTIDAVRGATSIISGTAPANSIVQIFADNKLIGTAPANGLDQWRFNISGILNKGPYAFTALALAPDGSTAQSAIRIISVVNDDSVPLRNTLSLIIQRKYCSA